ncbi:MAG: DNA-binding protein [Desulfobacteraceae bacterium IS3]|nr:MAG: DNA-binding protein [Desulfobacteraceae bacterium IS3]HAO21112.1 DNA-binding protein [Desulfobacteraceae bacterium]
MSQIQTESVLTLKEVAQYLKINEEKIEKQVLQGKIPGRRIEDEWRFLKTAIDDWLRTYDSRTILLSQSGALSDDDTADKLRLMIYSERGRPEKEV